MNAVTSATPVFGTSSDALVTPSMVIALAALAFTVISFWWMNVRRGSLRLHRPHSYAASVDPEDMDINLPLVFHNDGAAPIIIQDLRLRLERPPGEAPQKIGNIVDRPSEGLDAPEPLPMTVLWRGTRPHLRPADGGRQLPAVFPVPGRTAVTVFVEFGNEREPNKPPLNWIGGPCTATVEVKMSHRERWIGLLTFDLHTEIIDDSAYIVWANDPNWRP
ncbi:hypothetical protein ACK8GG_00005 [Micromonosporaceae bacterium DT55]|uniref:hypothetical protein n=1 Tax=Melissospora conviva TaxID=3388432 RepID=UPI003C2A5932